MKRAKAIGCVQVLVLVCLAVVALVCSKPVSSPTLATATPTAGTAPSPTYEPTPTPCTPTAAPPTPTRLPPTVTWTPTSVPATRTSVPSTATPVSPASPPPTKAETRDVTNLVVAPVLETPDQGANLGGEVVMLRWHWDTPLAEREYFDVRLWKEGQPVQGIAWAQQTWYEVRGLPGGKYSWSILVLLHTDTGADGTKEWKPVSEESEVRSFFYSPPTNPAPSAAPVLPTDTQPPPSATSNPATRTPVPVLPTDTQPPPSATSNPATQTPVPPQPSATRTRVPPTQTRRPTPTRVPGTITPVPSPPPAGTRCSLS
jgi:hypothetical protein